MLKLLFLGANPSDTSRIRLGKEVRAIDDVLRKSEFRDQIQLNQHWAVRTSDVQSLLLRHSPHIVHFSGHGNEASEIILEDQNGNSTPVPVHALKQLFSTLKGNIQCVVLNACYSEEQAKAIAEHVFCVVGMATEVEDQSAASFSSAFYQALGYGKDLQTAYQLGCVQIALDGLEGEDTPQLIALRGDPSKINLIKPKAPKPAAREKSFDRTGIEVYCKKPWSRLGASPRCTITLKKTGFLTKRKLMWEAFVFIPLEPDPDYTLAIKRPSDVVSFKAETSFKLRYGEVKRYLYESPAISFMAGEIRPFSKRELSS